MQYGSGNEWMIPDHAEGVRQLKYAYDKGINVSYRLEDTVKQRDLELMGVKRPLIPPMCTLLANPRSSWGNSSSSTRSRERAS